MKLPVMLWTTETVAARLLNHLQPLFLLALRLWVSWQFLKSGKEQYTTFGVLRFEPGENVLAAKYVD